TPVLLQRGPTIRDALEELVPLDRLLPGFRPRGLVPVHEQIKDHVIVAGYGLNGRNLTAALRSISAPYLIVELNAQTVRKARSEGEPAFYGDATRDEILRALGIDRARLFVIAISDPSATRRMPTGALGAMPQMHSERIVLSAKAPAVGQTIAETALRSKTGALILAVRRGESDLATPGADFQLDAGDVLVVVGQPQQIKSAN